MTSSSHEHAAQEKGPRPLQNASVPSLVGIHQGRTGELERPLCSAVLHWENPTKHKAVVGWEVPGSRMVP